MKKVSAITKIQAVAIAIVIIAAGIGATLLLTQSPAQTAIERIRIAIGIEPDTLDPTAQTTTLVANVMYYVYETLVKIQDPDGKIVPGLAESWTVSPDGLTYTFNLRRGVKFHDGSTLDANVVKQNFDRMLDPKTRSPQRAVVGHTRIDKVTVTGQYSLEIKLKEPFAPFLRGLASIHSAIISPLALQKYGTGLVDEPAGTGPFKFVKWNRGESLILQLFDEYWDQKATIKELVFRFIPEAASREAALLAGDVDIAVLPPASDVTKLRQDSRVKVYTPPTQRIIFITLNTQWGPLKDARVRQALNYAVDKNAIVEKVVFGLATPAVAPLPEFLIKNTRIGFYEYNPNKAKQLLAEAGYPNGFKMTLLHPVGRYIQDKQIAEAVQAYLREVGVEVELKTADWPTFVASINQKTLEEQIQSHQAVLLGWGYWLYDPHPQLYGQFHSSQWPKNGLAPAFYKNPRVDELLDQAAKTVDEEKRTQLYIELSKLIWEDAPWIFLHVQSYFIVARADLKDLIMQNNEMFFVTYAKL
uniref:ABC transporter substrate-binding protein n=1 Tax=Caldiarchaeum subterraneum TaxID=311458 RepID=A0A7C5U547_CALS0